MNRDDLEKAVKISDLLKTVETDMDQLSTIAHILAHGESNVKLRIEIEDITDGQPPEFIEHEVSTMFGVQTLRIADTCDCENCKKRRSEKKFLIEQKIMDTTALEILGVIVRKQIEKRHRLLDHLQTMGIDMSPKNQHKDGAS